MQFPTYDYVFVDEVQDLNPIQYEILKRVVKEDGRIIAVGDSHQAIYAFRGAYQDGMLEGKRSMGMKSLPLSKTYRCSQAVTAQAMEFNHYMGTFSSCPGSVRYAEAIPARNLIHTKGMMILSRYNAPLFQVAMRLGKNRVPFYMMGRDVVYPLMNIVKALDKKYSYIKKEYVEAMRQQEVDRRRGKGIRICNDMFDIIQMCVEDGNTTPGSIQDLLYDIFPKKEPAGCRIQLCTVHKSKGLEAHEVLLLNKKDFTPCDEHDPGQEHNIHYVAITRAKESLLYVESIV
jgi:superfamily I DNA/RNA helicase